MNVFSEENVGKSMVALCLMVVGVLFFAGSRIEELPHSGAWSIAFVRPFGSDTDVRLSNQSPSKQFTVSILVDGKVVSTTTESLVATQHVTTFSPSALIPKDTVLKGRFLVRVTDEQNQTQEIWKTLSHSL